ncbi:desulfoferrodoxin [Desulfoluna sp.]|uniref:desulfoferrodoxin n=1 Tax=Desulfoluna sp. TaxID=2045199 RepID=UPI00262A4A29|nr:desulfoferrodoxin [Desulfoluna sp.]
MIERNQIFKCSLCGNIVEVLVGSGPIPVCCGQEMSQLAENTEDAAVEKHVPVIEKIDGGVRVTVGEVAHPMLDAHYIQWIEVLSGGKVYRQYLSPGEAPEAIFMIEGDDITAREYCNLHGLWKK